MVVSLALALPIAAGAQDSLLAPIIVIGGDADERLRLAQLLGRDQKIPILIQSTSRLASALDTATAPASYRFALPELGAIRNSGLPFSMNDGPLWAGRGWNESVTPGVLVSAPHLRLILAPTLVSSDNEIFQTIPWPQGAPGNRSAWANPFHPLPESIDLPLRFGDRRIQRLDPGQSSLTVDAHGVGFGVATENLWWGPGIRNALVLSNDAPGFPHVFVQTKAPVSTRAGTFDAQWIVGLLHESAFFDSNGSNDTPSIAGIVATWRTPFDSAFTFGLSRIVIGARTTSDFPLRAAFDVFRSVGHLDVNGQPVPPNARDQITSLFARWLLPAAGFEAYLEWARFEEPLSLRDFLEYPGHSEGYTLGFQWAHPVHTDRTFRLQGEATYAELDPSLRLRPTAVTYTSRAVPQGFTNRGQMLGAAIGPGASSQWLAGEVFSTHWRFGPVLERIRWDNGTFEEPIVPFGKRPDVTMLGGLRGGYTWRGLDLLAEFDHAVRLNYLWQTYFTGGENTAGIDLVNNTLSITLSTALPR